MDVIIFFPVLLCRLKRQKKILPTGRDKTLLFVPRFAYIRVLSSDISRSTSSPDGAVLEPNFCLSRFLIIPFSSSGGACFESKKLSFRSRIEMFSSPVFAVFESFRTICSCYSIQCLKHYEENKNEVLGHKRNVESVELFYLSVSLMCVLSIVINPQRI